MPGRRTATSSESREMLIAAAAEVFAERGYTRATIEEVAVRAGISRGSVPWHFGNKLGLLQAVVQRTVGEAEEWMRLDRAVGTPTPAQGVARAVDFMRRPEAALLVSVIADALEPGSPLHDWYVDMHRSFRKIVQPWMEGSPLAETVGLDALTSVVVGAVMGLHQQWRLNAAQVDVVEGRDALVQILELAELGAGR